MRRLARTLFGDRGRRSSPAIGALTLSQQLQHSPEVLDSPRIKFRAEHDRRVAHAEIGEGLQLRRDFLVGAADRAVVGDGVAVFGEMDVRADGQVEGVGVAADLLASRLQGQDVGRSGFYDVVRARLGWSEVAADCTLPATLQAKLA